MSDLYPTPLSDRKPSKSSRPKGGKIDVVYDYLDERGQLLFQVVRMVPKDFRQRRPAPATLGKWLWNLDGVRAVPYRLLQLLEADVDEVVVICEGEKDCDRLATLGMVTTTNSGGAGKWRSELSEFLRGRRVVVLLDNDVAGESHGQIVARSLWGVASSVALLRLPGLPTECEAVSRADRS
jgi:putative DNA primase/helicase